MKSHSVLTLNMTPQMLCWLQEAVNECLFFLFMNKITFTESLYIFSYLANSRYVMCLITTWTLWSETTVQLLLLLLLLLLCLFRVWLMQIVLCCDVAVLNLSVRMRRGAAREPLARLLLITRLPPSSDMSSSDVASRWDGATEPHRLVRVHKNQTHLFVNTVVSHAAVSQKGSSCWSSQPSPPLLPLTTIADCHRPR